MTRPVRVVEVAGEPHDADRVLAALDEVLVPGADHALAVLPSRPAPWRDALTAAVEPDREVPDDVAVVLPTSGSTGAPAGVLLTASALTRSADSVLSALGGPGSWVLALPLTHVAGLMVLVRALRGGSAVRVADTRDGFHPPSFAAAVDGLPPGRAYASLVPTQLARLLAADERPGDPAGGLPGGARSRTDAPAALRRLDAVLLGGAAAPPALLREAQAAGVGVVRSYGMTETCGGCVLDGQPLPGVRIDLVAGRVQVTGPVLAWGLRRHGHDVRLPGRHVTADLGEWRDGRLHVLGRADDVVQSGGVSVPLATVESLLHEHPDVADVAAVGVDDPEWGARVVAVAVARAGLAAPPAAADVRAFVHARAEPAFVPADVVWVDALPRPAPGKIDRAALRALLAARAEGA